MDSEQGNENWHHDAVEDRLSDYPVSRLHQTYQPAGWNPSELRYYKVGRPATLFPKEKISAAASLNERMQNILTTWHHIKDKPEKLKDLPYEEALAAYLKIPHINADKIRKMAYDPRVRIDYGLAQEMDRLFGFRNLLKACAVRSNPKKPRPANVITLPYTLDPYNYHGKTPDHATLLRDICRTWKISTSELTSALNFKKSFWSEDKHRMPMRYKFDYVMASEEQPELFMPEQTPPEYNQPDSVPDDSKDPYDYGFNDDYDDDEWDNYDPGLDYYYAPSKAKEKPKPAVAKTAILGSEICALMDERIFSIKEKSGPFKRYFDAACNDPSRGSLYAAQRENRDRYMPRRPKKIQWHNDNQKEKSSRKYYVNVNEKRDAFYRALSEATNALIVNPADLKEHTSLSQDICQGWIFWKDGVNKKTKSIESHIVNPIENLPELMSDFLISIADFGKRSPDKTDDDYMSYSDLRQNYIMRGQEDYLAEKMTMGRMSEGDYFLSHMNEFTHNDIQGLKKNSNIDTMRKEDADRLLIDRSLVEKWLKNGAMLVKPPPEYIPYPHDLFL